jgi:hypothetical protein
LESSTRTSPVTFDRTRILLVGVASERPAGTLVTADWPSALAAKAITIKLQNNQ